MSEFDPLSTLDLDKARSEFYAKHLGLPDIPISTGKDQARTLIAVFGIVDAAIYLIGVMAIGVATSHPVSWFGALVSAGLGYLASFAQISVRSPGPAIAALIVCLALFSVGVGALAGILLLF